MLDPSWNSAMYQIRMAELEREMREVQRRIDELQCGHGGTLPATTGPLKELLERSAHIRLQIAELQD